MYDYIKGILTDKNYPYCTVENQGIGYHFLVNSRILAELGEIDNEIKIYTKLIHKEDSMTLCGFKHKQDRIIFDILTSVSGVGIKVAFALLDEFETNDLIQAVLEENHKLISKTKGIGPKMAQKIVLEIKDKLTKMNTSAQFVYSKVNNNKISSATISEVITILQSLGYNQKEYESALELVSSKAQKDDSQELLKEVLQILSAF